METEQSTLVQNAISGDKKALEELLGSVEELIYNLSLRMLGNPSDAEDATQEIYIRIMTRLSTFEGKSAFSTWVYRIAINHILNYKKHLYAQNAPLSFELFGEDLEMAKIESLADMTGGVDENILAEELKMSCTNTMLQCFDENSRLIYILGVMFKVDSTTCGELLGITPDAYRQRLSRIRKKLEIFLGEYCGLAGSEKCSCKNRISYAVQEHRLDPNRLVYFQMTESKRWEIDKYTNAMEKISDQIMVFSELPKYHSPISVRKFIENILASDEMKVIQEL